MVESILPRQLDEPAGWKIPKLRRQLLPRFHGAAANSREGQLVDKKPGWGTATAYKNRRHDNTRVLGGAKHGAWTPHDLRRTSATIMQSLGIPLDTIDRCQNHVLQGSKIRRHYLHHDYAQEKREAWRHLGERTSMILNAKKVD
jgi:integrase